MKLSKSLCVALVAVAAALVAARAQDVYEWAFAQPQFVYESEIASEAGAAEAEAEALGAVSCPLVRAAVSAGLYERDDGARLSRLHFRPAAALLPAGVTLRALRFVDAHCTVDGTQFNVRMAPADSEFVADLPLGPGQRAHCAFTYEVGLALASSGADEYTAACDTSTYELAPYSSGSSSSGVEFEPAEIMEGAAQYDYEFEGVGEKQPLQQQEYVKAPVQQVTTQEQQSTKTMPIKQQMQEQQYVKTMPVKQQMQEQQYVKTMPVKQQMQEQEYVKTMPVKQQEQVQYVKTMPVKQQMQEQQYVKTLPVKQVQQQEYVKAAPVQQITKQQVQQEYVKAPIQQVQQVQEQQWAKTLPVKQVQQQQEQVQHVKTMPIKQQIQQQEYVKASIQQQMQEQQYVKTMPVKEVQQHVKAAPVQQITKQQVQQQEYVKAPIKQQEQVQYVKTMPIKQQLQQEYVKAPIQQQ